jgi:hypothetical protein
LAQNSFAGIISIHLGVVQFQNPNGIPSFSQVCSARATLGTRPKKSLNSEGVASNPPESPQLLKPNPSETQLRKERGIHAASPFTMQNAQTFSSAPSILTPKRSKGRAPGTRHSCRFTSRNAKRTEIFQRLTHSHAEAT